MELQSKVDAAIAEVTAAEGALDGVLRELRAGARAEKVTVSSGVEQAFVRLRAARAELARLRDVVAGL